MFVMLFHIYNYYYIINKTMITFFIELFYYFDILLCCIIFGPIKDTTCYFFNDTQTLVLIAYKITLILYFIITIYY